MKAVQPILTVCVVSCLLLACQKESLQLSKTQPSKDKELNVDDFGRQLIPTTRNTDFRSAMRKRTTTSAVFGNVFLIDANGHLVENTSWNVNGPIAASSANISGDELQRIVDSVSWDFREFGVTITTDENIYNRTDARRRMRAIITDNHSWFGTNAGGTSYTGSFSWGDNTPCFVFSSLLGYDIKAIAEAVSHELGHTVGLRHQALWDNGVMISDYNDQPQNNGVYYIMGLPYNGVANFGTGLNPYGTIQNDNTMLGEVLGAR
jgi:hypothetical protein